MSNKIRIALCAGLAMLAAGFFAGPATAASVADFYKGKVMNFLVGFGPGGGYDRYARTVSRGLGRHIPGNPKIIPQFMTGGGSLRMANYLANVAPKDGSYMGIHSPVLPVDQLIRGKGFKFDVRNFTYLGRLATQNHVMMVRADHGIKTLDDVRKKQMTVSSTGHSSPTYILPTIMNSALGTRFKVITGYAGSAAGRFAMESGEVMGLTSGWISWKANWPDKIKSKFMLPLVEFALVRSPDLDPSVPLMSDLARSKEDRELLEFIAAPLETGRTIALPPGVPKDRVKALRRAFDAMVKDPRFLADAKKWGIAIIPLEGEKVQALINKTINVSPALVARVKKALKRK